jgi:hypothetical protein
MARVFDRKEDPKGHVYASVSDPPSHSFLVSVPLIDFDSAALIYGILNLGTFSKDQAEVIHKIGAPQELTNIASYAQSYVLKRLMELLNV